MTSSAIPRRPLFGYTVATAVDHGVGALLRRKFSSGAVTKLAAEVAAGRVAPLMDPSDTDLIRAFQSASSGQLMRLYQHFPRADTLAIASGPEVSVADVVRRIEARCSAELLQAPNGVLDHRVLVLPVVASIHAINMADGDDRRDMIARVTRIHADALNGNLGARYSARDVLEMLWQNLTAALIKDPTTWGELRVTFDVIDQAEAVITLFLNGAEPLLLEPSLLAWQFLLTYECALVASGDREAGQVHDWMRAIATRYQNTRSFAWLAALSRLFEGRTTREEMFPQISEAFMGAVANPAEYGGIASVATLARLVNHAESKRIASGERGSMFTTQQRAAEDLSQSLSFAANYGIGPEAKSRLTDLRSQLGLPDAVDEQISEALADYPTYAGKHDVEHGEAEQAHVLAFEIPFWRRGEERVLRRLNRSIPEFNELCERAVRDQNRDKLRELVNAAALVVLGDEAKKSLTAFQRDAKAIERVRTPLLDSFANPASDPWKNFARIEPDRHGSNRVAVQVPEGATRQNASLDRSADIVPTSSPSLHVGASPGTPTPSVPSSPLPPSPPEVECIEAIPGAVPCGRPAHQDETGPARPTSESSNPNLPGAPEDAMKSRVRSTGSLHSDRSLAVADEPVRFVVSEALLRRIRKSSFGHFKDGRAAGKRVVMAVDVVGGFQWRRRDEECLVEFARSTRFRNELIESLSYDGSEAEFAKLQRAIIHELMLWVKVRGAVRFSWGCLMVQDESMVLSIANESPRGPTGRHPDRAEGPPRG